MFCILTADLSPTDCPSSQYGPQILSSSVPLPDSSPKLQHNYDSHSQPNQSFSSFRAPERFPGTSCSGLWLFVCPVQLISVARTLRHMPGHHAEPGAAPVTVPAQYNSPPTPRLPSRGHSSPPEVYRPRRIQPEAHIAQLRVLLQCKL